MQLCKVATKVQQIFMELLKAVYVGDMTETVNEKPALPCWKQKGLAEKNGDTILNLTTEAACSNRCSEREVLLSGALLDR